MKNFPPHYYAVGAALCWAAMDVLVRALSAELDPVTSAAARLTIAAAVLFVVNALFWKEKISPRQVIAHPLLLAVALLNALTATFLSFAVEKTTVGNAIFLLYTEPVIASVLAYLFLSEKLSKTKIYALIAGVAGLALILQPSAGGSTAGNLAGLATGFTYAFFVLASRRLSGKLHPVVTTFWMLALGGLGLLAFSQPQKLLSLTPSGGIVLAALSILIIGAFLLFNSAIRSLAVSTASIILLVEPLAATFAASTFYGEKYGMLALAGYALVGLGVLFALKESGGKNKDEKRKKQEK